MFPAFTSILSCLLDNIPVHSFLKKMGFIAPAASPWLPLSPPHSSPRRNWVFPPLPCIFIVTPQVSICKKCVVWFWEPPTLISLGAPHSEGHCGRWSRPVPLPVRTPGLQGWGVST